MHTISVIGSGSWGIALALHCHKLGHRVSLWAPSPNEYRRLIQLRVNEPFLPGHTIPVEITISNRLEVCCHQTDGLLFAVPSHAMRSVAAGIKPMISPGCVMISAAKGIETDSLKRMSEVLAETFGGNAILALSGPSFAVEMARGDPTAIVLACEDISIAKTWQQELSGCNVRLYANEDMIGTELGGAVKNVIAIASGVLYGLGYGTNTVAALITRGLSEMKRLALAAGGKADTMSGLAGLGDLVLTCTGSLSRNRRVGIALGKGGRLAAILEELGQVAEGVKTTESTVGLAKRYGVEMPIVAQMYSILYEGTSPQKAIAELMIRELKLENGS